MRLFIVLLWLAAGCGVARAEDAVTHADLLCGRNVALARFALARNDDPPHYAILPPKLDEGLSARARTDRTDCQLSRGMDIRIRAGEEQAFGYGMGGANPPAFFSLWIGHRKILSKFVWKPGYGDSFDNKAWLVGLVIRGESLTFCYRKVDDKEVRCEQQRLELRRHPIDTEEYPGKARPKPVVGSILVEPASADADTCQRHLDAIEKDAKSPFDGLPFDSRLSETMTSQQSGDNYSLRTLAGTFSNIGARHITALGSDKHYFDGDIIVLAPRDTSLDDIVAAFPGEDIENELAKPKQAGWTILSGGQPSLYPTVSPRYVHFVPETIDGELLYLAYPTNRGERPTGILLKPLPTAGFASLCNFQRAEPHY